MKNLEKNFSDLYDALVWHQEAGVDLSVGEKPIDWLNAPPLKKISPALPKIIPIKRNKSEQIKKSKPALENVNIADVFEVDVKEAEKLAKTAKTLMQLKDILEKYNGCPLKKRASNLVFGAGDENAKIMFVAYSPSDNDDLEGQAFTGNQGALLDKMLASIGLNRAEVYLSNILFWRPPGARKATDDELATSLPFFMRQVELLNPKIIVTFGENAPQVLFENKIVMNKIRGKWQELKIGSLNMKIICTFHPRFLLKQPAQKRLAWQDLLLLKAAIKDMNNDA